MAVTGDPAAYLLAYEAGLQAVEKQASTLAETRDRAGALLSAAAVAAGLAAGLAFSGDRIVGVDAPGAIGAGFAIAGFVVVVVSTVMIWRPTEGRFVHDAGVIIGSYVEGNPPRQLPELHRELALWLGKQTESNREMLEVELKTFTVGLVGLLVQMAGMIVVLGDVARG
ncbi:MAG TPA: hypothetical protein VNA57_09550 [Acidimicrobiales bacterium]|nr:hypothetical protein [Acidimicrobiales bacterium]